MTIGVTSSAVNFNLEAESSIAPSPVPFLRNCLVKGKGDQTPCRSVFQDGLVKTNMEKLTFYALSAPEKLDRIGAYLSERLIRDVGRHRYG